MDDADPCFARAFQIDIGHVHGVADVAVAQIFVHFHGGHACAVAFGFDGCAAKMRCQNDVLCMNQTLRRKVGDVACHFTGI